ncbi:MAG: UDP-N-acetylglucosamine 1-carboxyvinyltransferase [Deltaproteobacteria bacterium]|nr:UDP-N-acetylglucosamine 1-carboxyvinyltransferase [Deltaproteobacteria bacterium]
MNKFLIQGGIPLKGEVKISGAKNSALPILCSSILAEDKCRYLNIPNLKDVSTMIKVLETLGAKVSKDHDNTIIVDPSGIALYEAPYDLVKTMRASILVLGPLIAKYKKARISLPGGCAIGVRPIDQHLKGLAKMGAHIEMSHGYVLASTKGLKGARIVFDKPTVGGTENIMMAATMAEGKTIIEGAAKEPEIADLADVLNKMGAKIKGAGEATIIIEGVKKLSKATHTIIPDRIEAGTFMVASAITKGNLTIKGARVDHILSIIEKLRGMGVVVNEIGKKTLIVDGNNELKPIDVETAPFPGFPTDMQAQTTALACIADGVSSITENIFENRFMHVPELMRMGANLEEKGRTVLVRGVNRLQGATVMATDLRASASLVLAALNAKGTTEIRRIYHLDRGYENIDKKLLSLGARIERESGGL